MLPQFNIGTCCYFTWSGGSSIRPIRQANLIVSQHSSLSEIRFFPPRHFGTPGSSDYQNWSCWSHLSMSLITLSLFYWQVLSFIVLSVCHLFCSIMIILSDLKQYWTPSNFFLYAVVANFLVNIWDLYLHWRQVWQILT